MLNQLVTVFLSLVFLAAWTESRTVLNTIIGQFYPEEDTYYDGLLLKSTSESSYIACVHSCVGAGCPSCAAVNFNGGLDGNQTNCEVRGKNANVTLNKQHKDGWISANIVNIGPSGNDLETLCTCCGQDNNSTRKSSGCGGKLSGPHGIFQSPNHPKLYQNYLKCDWLISAKPLHRISVKFKDFSLETYGRCRFDSVIVYDGKTNSAPIIGTYCGSIPDFVVTSRGDNMLVTFRTDAAGTYKGFSAQYEAQDCGGTLTRRLGRITSPNYPSLYNNTLICNWSILAWPKPLISVWFTELVLEYNDTCSSNSVTVYDGQNNSFSISKTYCGTKPPFQLMSKGNSMLITFKADRHYNDKRFSAQYQILDCGGIFNGSRGMLQSPNYPSPYGNYMACDWLILAQPYQFITVNFTDFSLEKMYKCRYDNVTVYDGKSPSAGSKGTYCGNMTSFAVNSTRNMMLVTFRTDGSKTYKGFSAQYEVK